MSIAISTAHAEAVAAAIRLPALAARLALLVGGEVAQSSLAIYGDAVQPDPGATPPTAALAVLPMSERAGVVDEEAFQIVFDTPLEAQIVGADPAVGTVPTWARVSDPAGGWWADVTVSVTGGGGVIEMAATVEEGEPPAPVARMYQGAMCRIFSFVFQG